MLFVTEVFNIAVNDFDAKEFARYSRVLVVNELAVSGTQYKMNGKKRIILPVVQIDSSIS